MQYLHDVYAWKDLQRVKLRRRKRAFQLLVDKPENETNKELKRLLGIAGITVSLPPNHRLEL
jgi:hypothetical protein